MASNYQKRLPPTIPQVKQKSLGSQEDKHSIEYEEAYSYLNDSEYRGDYLELNNICIIPALNSLDLTFYETSISSAQSPQSTNSQEVPFKKKVASIVGKYMVSFKPSKLKLPKASHQNVIKMQVKSPSGIIFGDLPKESNSNKAILYNKNGAKVSEVAFGMREVHQKIQHENPIYECKDENEDDDEDISEEGSDKIIQSKEEDSNQTQKVQQEVNKIQTIEEQSHLSQKIEQQNKLQPKQQQKQQEVQIKQVKKNNSAQVKKNNQAQVKKNTQAQVKKGNSAQVKKNNQTQVKKNNQVQVKKNNSAQVNNLKKPQHSVSSHADVQHIEENHSNNSSNQFLSKVSSQNAAFKKEITQYKPIETVDTGMSQDGQENSRISKPSKGKLELSSLMLESLTQSRLKTNREMLKEKILSQKETHKNSQIQEMQWTQKEREKRGNQLQRYRQLQNQKQIGLIRSKELEKMKHTSKYNITTKQKSFKVPEKEEATNQEPSHKTSKWNDPSNYKIPLETKEELQPLIDFRSLHSYRKMNFEEAIGREITQKTYLKRYIGHSLHKSIQVETLNKSSCQQVDQIQTKEPQSKPSSSRKPGFILSHRLKTQSLNQCPIIFRPKALSRDDPSSDHSHSRKVDNRKQKHAFIHIQNKMKDQLTFSSKILQIKLGQITHKRSLTKVVDEQYIPLSPIKDFSPVKDVLPVKDESVSTIKKEVSLIQKMKHPERQQKKQTLQIERQQKKLKLQNEGQQKKSKRQNEGQSKKQKILTESHLRKQKIQNESSSIFHKNQNSSNNDLEFEPQQHPVKKEYVLKQMQQKSSESEQDIQFDIIISNLSVNLYNKVFGRKYIELRLDHTFYTTDYLYGSHLLWVGHGYLFQNVTTTQQIELSLKCQSESTIKILGKANISIGDLLLNYKKSFYQCYIFTPSSDLLAVLVIGYQILTRHNDKSSFVSSKNPMSPVHLHFPRTTQKLQRREPNSMHKKRLSMANQLLQNEISRESRSKVAKKYRGGHNIYLNKEDRLKTQPIHQLPSPSYYRLSSDKHLITRHNQ